ncbi:LacI family DNA-binding transcriptional regulator [Lactococcus protaetiae]|uniref:LacI family transcriptional regulator n=1 Tax=Lactococcus protaetiae TaxID=2592653 RepID=A0A514Z6M4_9LACT|nr:LacI family DNA-binding transcriptional regulator [Lactococcus protaetiae]QDK70241.1 LacI family transcriptional regulator [Lactococcus protaetiae]
MIGVLMSTEYREQGKIFQEDYHGALIASIESRIREAGYFMLLYGASNVNEAVYALRSWQVDGIIVLESKPADTAQFLSVLTEPTVFIDGAVSDQTEAIYNITSDDFDGGRQVGRYLLAQGLSRVAFFADEEMPFGVDLARFQGLKSVSADSRYFTLSVEKKIRLNQFKQWISTGNLEKFDALFLSSDYFATDILSVLTEMEISVPNQISVIGYDDGPLAEFAQLSTIKQDVLGKGKCAVDLLLAKIEGKEIYENEILLPVQFINRKTVKEK